jgi:hypothetical protein
MREHRKREGIAAAPIPLDHGLLQPLLAQHEIERVIRHIEADRIPFPPVDGRARPGPGALGRPPAWRG